MSKYTPGPWEFRKDDGWRLYAGENCLMGDEQYYPWVPDNEADWRLIASAPELLEALQEIVAQWGDYPFSGLYLARAAIAKATGGEA